MWTSRPKKALSIVAVFFLALLLDYLIESQHLRPGRHLQAPLDFPSGLLILPVPVAFALMQLGWTTQTLEWVGRSLWLPYIALATGIVAAGTRGRAIRLSILLLVMLAFNLLGILAMSAMSGIG